MAQVSFANVTVEYPIYCATCRSLTFTLLNLASGGKFDADSKGRVSVTALRNLEFELNEGDKIGLLGHDEPEKSTLLRTRVEAFVPTHGRVNVPRTVESLIEIALGINLEATGRENVFLLGRLLGMTKAEIEQSYGAFDEFTELGDFMELQMMAYSSEMQLRLAFAVATMATSDIWSWTSGCPRKVKTFRF